MGRLHTKDVMGNLWKDRLFHLVHWLSIILLLQRISQESISLERKSLPGLFLGYALFAVRNLKGDIMVADIEDLETMDASEIYSKRLNAKEVIFPKEKGEFIFPIADGRIKTPGGDQELKTPTLMREHPIRGGSHVDFLGESEGSPPSPPQDSYPDAGEAINDLLVHVRKLHIPQSRWTLSQTLLADRRIIPYSTEIHWRIQNYSYEFGCQAGETHRWLLEHRWIKRFVWFFLGQVSLSLLYWKINLQTEKCGPGRDWQNGR